jgi:hypothetical protein
MSFNPIANHAVKFFNTFNLKLTAQKTTCSLHILLEQIYIELTYCHLLALWKNMLLNYCEGHRSFVALLPRTNHVVAVIPLAKAERSS